MDNGKWSLKKERDLLIESLENMDPDDPDYSERLRSIERVSELAEKRKRFRPSADAILAAATTIGGIVIMLFGEVVMNEVITSKGLTLLGKPKF